MSKKTNNPFSKIDKSRFPKKRAEKSVEQPAPAVPETRPEENDSDIFFRAMSGVRTLDPSGGREIAPKPAPAAPPQPSGDEDESVKTRLMDLVSGKVEFDLNLTDEFVQGQVKGLDSKTVGRLKAGYYSPEAHLDLHGQNALQAYSSLINFIRDNYLANRRCLLLIPGRGKNSPEGYGILKDKLQSWLTRDPFKRVVLAFSSALPKHGGTGALYVLLRKYKKTGGKIIWDKNPTDADLI